MPILEVGFRYIRLRVMCFIEALIGKGSVPMTKYDLAEQSFKVVLRHLEHEDGKANRLLTAMAFVAVAVATVFIVSVDDPNPTWKLAGRSIDLAILSFSVFLVMVGLGVTSMMGGLGPRFNWPWSEASETTSFLFAKSISSHSYKEWKNDWERTDSDIHSVFVDQLIDETYLIARKADHKVRWVGYGSYFFRFSFVPLSFFVGFAFVESASMGFWLGMIGVSGVLFFIAFAELNEPAGFKHRLMGQILKSDGKHRILSGVWWFLSIFAGFFLIFSLLFVPLRLW